MPQSWFERHPVEVAFDVIGCWFVVVREGIQLRLGIVETEACGGMEDAASHATMYRVGRETLAGSVGMLYTYRAYGIHTMTNVVAHGPAKVGAVLLRAADDPLAGSDVVASRISARHDRFLKGPGNPSRGQGMALSDTLAVWNGDDTVWMESGERPRVVVATPRIGISRATHAR